jgi:uncharacterized protein with PIN domain
MRRASFRFYAELNDFLPPARRGVAFAHEFRGSPSVKDVVESLGVPHAEIDLLLADGEPVDFGWRVRDGARVSVYPVFESLDVGPLTRVRSAPLRRTRFALDGHLGRLARYLRMAGFDALWRADWDDAELARLAAAEQRILLTRDRGLLMRRAVTHGHWMRETDPRRQLAEVLRRFDLSRSVDPFRRCLRCNDPLVPVAKPAVAGRLPPRVAERHDEYRLCPACGRVYWRGTHCDRMERLVAEAVALAAEPPPRAP